MRLLALAALASPIPVAAQAPQPGPLRTFADWTVGCDNGRACRAVALVPEDDDRDRYLLLTVARDGAGPAQARLIVPRDQMNGRAAGLFVDGRRVAGVPAGGENATLPLVRPLADALAQGRMVALGDGRGPPVASASLKGLAAALLYIDDRQRRVGTVGALRRPGRASDPRRTLALPVIAVPPTGAAPARTMPIAAAAAAIGAEAASCDYAQGTVAPRAVRLDARHSLVLVDHVCGNGAYNVFTSVFVLDEAGRAARARFDAPVGMGEGGLPTLVNGDWDPAKRRLASFAKARGLGDCGTMQEFAWDGARFRLTEQAEMSECRGSIDYITTWRARVR